MVWREHQKQWALRAGYTAAKCGGDEGSWATAAARVGNGAAESSGCGSGGASFAASPAIAAVGTQQQLDRIEAAIAKLGTELEKVREQLDRLELSMVTIQ
jgi:phage shock protein A